MQHIQTKRPPRDYQLACVQATLASPAKDKYYVLPTGTGKTRVLTLLIEELQQQGRVLVVAHRKELIEQTASSIREDIPGSDVGIVMAEQNDCSARVVVGTIQTLAPGRVEELFKGQLWLDPSAMNFSGLLIDECHHCIPKSAYTSLIEAMRIRCPEIQVIGCTATPYRSDKATMQEVLPVCTFFRDIATMQERGWLCPLEWQSVRIPMLLDLMKTSSIGGEKDYNADELYKQISPQTAYIVEQTAPHFGKRPAMVFACNVAHAYELADAYNAWARHDPEWQGLRNSGDPFAMALDGTTPKQIRDSMLKAWKAGAFQVMVNCALFIEGFDYIPLPPNKNGLGTVVIASPTMSPSRYLQMVGRGTRLKPGGGDFQDCLVFDVAQNANLLETKQITLPRVMPSRPADLDEQIEQEKPVRFGDPQEKERKIKLIRLQDFGSVSWAAWGHRANGNLYYCGLGGDKTTGRAYAVILPTSRGDGLFYGYVLSKITKEWDVRMIVDQAKPLTELAHHYNHLLSINGRKNLVSKDAPWRHMPASEKAVRYLWSQDAALGQQARETYWTGEQVSFELDWLTIRGQVGRLQYMLAKEATEGP
jgi:superfamily II DNA or RNA helicase